MFGSSGILGSILPISYCCSSLPTSSFFSFHSTKSTYYLFRKRLNYGRFHSAFKVYHSYFTFGRIQLDRVAITSGLKDRYTFEFDGVENIEALLKKGRGGILLTAHIGNFNLAKHFF